MPLDAIRFALGTFTAIPVRVSRTDRTVAGRAIALAPLVGALVGAVAAGVLVLARELQLSPLVAAGLAVAATAALTRALHLDGLADFADGVASARPPAEAVAVMKRSDVGPFGVVALVVVLMLQVGALAEAAATGAAWAAAVIAGMTGRAAVTVACRRGVPAATATGLGAHVAGTQPPARVAVVVTAVVAASAALSYADGGPGWRGPLAVLGALAAAAVLERVAVRRLGGVTGDVLGALVEVATTAALVCMVIG